MTKANKLSDIPKTKHIGVLEYFNQSCGTYRDEYDVDGFNYYTFENEADLIVWLSTRVEHYRYVIIDACPMTVKTTMSLVR